MEKDFVELELARTWVSGEIIEKKIYVRATAIQQASMIVYRNSTICTVIAGGNEYHVTEDCIKRLMGVPRKADEDLPPLPEIEPCKPVRY